MNDKIMYKNGCVIGKKYKCGMEFSFDLAIPTAQQNEYALLLENDGLNDANVKSMLQLAQEGFAPYCVCVGVWPANQIVSNGEKYNRRINSYDLFNSEYADFIVYELIPYIEKEYGIRFAKNPDMRYVSGGSSGGMSAFVTAWFHTEYFHRVYMSSPSFLAMGRGNEIPYLIRKCETKPLKIYVEYSQNEPNDYFGASCPIDIETKMALEFAGYDFAYEYFSGEGHCSRYKDYDCAYKRNKWIWDNYKTKKIVAPRNSPSIDRFISIDSKWEKVENFPQKQSFNADLLADSASSVLSADGQFVYTANKDEDEVYAYTVKDNMQIADRCVHAMLHTAPGIYPKGAISIAVDVNDRLYVLTAIGIQCVRSYGLIDAILDLPVGKPLEICVTDGIYVKTTCGVYKRNLRQDYVNEKRRLFVSYYD